MGFITFLNNAIASLMERVSIKLVAIPDHASSTNGPEGTRPGVGLNPNKPQQAAGIRIDPPPSLAVATGAIPAIMAAAEPPEDPPAVLIVSKGFLQGPNKLESVTQERPNSEVFVFANGTKPRAINLLIKSLLVSARLFEKILTLPLVECPLWHGPDP